MADTAESSNKKIKRPSNHPKWYDMVIEAVTNSEDTKGASVIAIKKYIMGAYPEADQATMKNRVRQALEKGLQCNVLKRPKAFEEASIMSSRFKLDKVSIAAEAKAKAKKAKKAEETKKAAAEKKKKETKKKSPTKTKKSVKDETTKKVTAKSTKAKPKTVTTPKATKPKPKKAEMKTPKRPKSATAKSRIIASEIKVKPSSKTKAASKTKATPKKGKARAKS